MSEYNQREKMRVKVTILRVKKVYIKVYFRPANLLYFYSHLGKIFPEHAVTWLFSQAFTNTLLSTPLFHIQLKNDNVGFVARGLADTIIWHF